MSVRKSAAWRANTRLIVTDSAGVSAALAGEYSRSRSHRIDTSLVVASLLAVLREAFDIGGQVTHKGVWGMSWHQEALKGVEDCEKPRVAVKRAMILGYPNWRMMNP